jgi:hypothetical protein
VAVREDRRNCLWTSEERRFTVVRGDQEHTLGRRRFRVHDFQAASYRWQAAVSQAGEVRVDVHNQGHPDISFREGTAAERAH